MPTIDEQTDSKLERIELDSTTDTTSHASSEAKETVAAVFARMLDEHRDAAVYAALDNETAAIHADLAEASFRSLPAY